MINRHAPLPHGWRLVQLKDIVARVERRVEGSPQHVLMISSREGFIPQSDRYSRFMAGESLKKYVELRDGEFAYNRGNSLAYPQGCIYQLRGYRSAAVPHVYFCFAIDSDGAFDSFLDHYFRSGGLNLQLEGRINSGVRNNGLMNIKAESFFGVQLQLPPLAEQRKIAAILSSVEDAIKCTQAVIDQLQVIKKAMMAELLTRGLPGRHTRFKQTEIGEVPEGWGILSGESLFTLSGGYGPSDMAFSVEGPALFLKVDDFNHARNQRGLQHAALRYDPDKNPRVKTYAPGNLVFPKRGAAIFKNRVQILAQSATVDPNLMVLAPEARLDATFFMYEMLHIGLHNLSDNSGIPQINNKHLYPHLFAVPPLDEQHAVGEVLGSVDSRIEAEQLKRAALADTKSALMSVLLTGEIRVTPDEATPS